MKRHSLCAHIGLTLKLSLLSATIGAASISPGDIIVSELLVNPAAVSDSNGEWLELYNTSSVDIDLNGLVLRDNGTNYHTIAAAEPLLIAPGQYRLLGRNGDSLSNGGYQADYVYKDFTLANSSDAVVIEWHDVEIFNLSYSSGDNFGQAGISMGLTALADSFNAASYLATGPGTVFGDGDRGSPGSGPFAASVSEVPVPAAGWLFCSGLGLIAGIKRRQRR